MQQINCLNLCEILPLLKSKHPVEQVFEESCRLANFDTCERIYIGSSFCGKYFIHQSQGDFKDIFNFCKEKQKKITLVVPTFSEGDLEHGKRRIKEMVTMGVDCIDEVTVNDYGMLSYLRERYSQSLNLGRMFMKEYRDPRYQEYFQMPWKPKMFTDYMRRIIEEYQINSCEFDLTHKKMIFSEIPKEIVPAIHTPYCYQTVGRICEYASTDKEIAKKFRPNDACNQSCVRDFVKYSVAEENMEYIRYGRTIYFRHSGYELEGIEQYRKLFFPIDLEMNPEKAW